VLQRLIELAQFTAIRYSDRLTEADIAASIGSVGDSYDCEHDPPAGRRLEGMLVRCCRAVV
jgi:putative transposase